jgi:hypothetical protein
MRLYIGHTRDFYFFFSIAFLFFRIILHIIWLGTIRETMSLDDKKWVNTENRR